uniref:Uncharacterized protein n=1 Tax=Anopheles dirus TaxID=7168 RepID=A0A182NCL7_9DIPT
MLNENDQQMQAIKRTALHRSKYHPPAMNATNTTSAINCNLWIFLWPMLLYLCMSCTFAQEIPSEAHPNGVERHEIANDFGAPTVIQELPRPIITFPSEQNETNADALEISPRRHKTRRKGGSTGANANRSKPKKRKNAMQTALHAAARKGLEAMIELYDRAEPNLLKRGAVLDANEPGALLAQFSASNQTELDAKAAYATLVAAKKFKERYNEHLLIW